MRQIGLMLLMTIACGGNDISKVDEDRVDTTGASGAGPAIQQSEWRHSRSSMVAKLGDPRHSGNDEIVNPNSGTELEGKFAYGKVSKDLEDEDVTLFVELGSGWKSIGTGRTNGDGRVRFDIAAGSLGAGTHKYRMIAHGDLSMAEGSVWVLEPRSRIAVFDIDGTLTSGGFVRKNLYGRDIQPRPSAVELTRRWKARGVQPVYLTARPYLYNRYSRAWLGEHGFEPGPVIHSDSIGDSLPSHRAAGKFKQDWLKAFLARTELEVSAAYGDKDTDVCAFARAGIDPKLTWIWGEEARACQEFEAANATTDYAAHIAETFE